MRPSCIIFDCKMHLLLVQAAPGGDGVGGVGGDGYSGGGGQEFFT